MDFSEFAHKLGQSILGALYKGLYGVCESLYDGMFSILDARIIESSNMLQLCGISNCEIYCRKCFCADGECFYCLYSRVGAGAFIAGE